MLLLLSPAKSLDMESTRSVGTSTKVSFSTETQELVTHMRDKNVVDLVNLMKISERIFRENISFMKMRTITIMKEVYLVLRI